MGDIKSINEPWTPTAPPAETPPEPTEPPVDPPVNPAAPPPHLSGLQPQNAFAGDGVDVELQVIGSDFTAESVVMFDGQDKLTTYVSATELTVIVEPSLYSPSEVPVMVRNGDGQESDPLPFEFIAP